MDVVQVHAALQRIPQEAPERAPDDVEGLEGASCPPYLKRLARTAMGSAAEGLSADQWRSSVVDDVGQDVTPLTDEAADCMHHSGLWPWR